MSETVIDTKGRKIEVQALVGSKLSRFILACGDGYGENLWSSATTARATVRAVDGKPTPPLPTNLEQVHTMWDAVDDAAAGAALKWLIDQQTAMMADAKNSQGHPASESEPGS